VTSKSLKSEPTVKIICLFPPLRKLGIASRQRLSVMTSRCSLSRPSVASTTNPRLFAGSSKLARLLKKFSPCAPHLASASTTLGVPLTYQLLVAVCLKLSSTKQMHLLGSIRVLLNSATIFLIPLAIVVATNMNLGTGVSTISNPMDNRAQSYVAGKRWLLLKDIRVS